MIKNFSTITINGIDYIPTPHEVDPTQPKDLVWHQYPPHAAFLADPTWFDTIGQDPIESRRIWLLAEDAQMEEIAKLLAEHSDHRVNMLFDAAAKGKPHVVRFLLAEGVKLNGDAAKGEDDTWMPLHAAAYRGRLECVKILVEEAGLSPNERDDLGGTPLMRACWGGRENIVAYLLEHGADMTIRQTATIRNEDSNTGVNAFEFAAGSGSIECARKLIDHGKMAGLDVTELASQASLAGAAQSGNLEMLHLVFELGNYPQQDANGIWRPNVSTITEHQKSALLYALQIALTRSQKALPLLISYIEVLDPVSKEPVFSSLSQETFDKLVAFIYGLAANPEAVDQELLLLVLKTFFTSIYDFSSSSVREQNVILNDAFVVAARYSNTEMLQLLLSLPSIRPEWNVSIDPNHLSQDTAPIWTTALYCAAAQGHIGIVNLLIYAFDTALDVHLGNGEFVNGPTALFRAVWDGRLDIVRLMLLRYGGPVSDIDSGLWKAIERETEDTAEASAERQRDEITQKVLEDEDKDSAFPSELKKQSTLRIVIVATMSFPYSVAVMNEDTWVQHSGDTLLNEQGKLVSHKQMRTADETQVARMVLDLEEDDMEWLRKLQWRKSDQELLASEKSDSKRTLNVAK